MKIFLASAGGIVLMLVILTAVFIAANWAPERTVADLKARWAPPPSTFIEVDGMLVHLRDEGPRGDPAPIVLLHGTGSSLHAWEGWAKELKAGHRVISFDLPGFGLTGPSPDRVYSSGRDVKAVIGVLDKLGIEHCVLGGNSLGGGIAWQTALAYPSRVEKLILVDAAGYPPRPSSVPLGFVVAGLPGVPWLLQNTIPRFLVEQGYRNVFGDPDKVTPGMVDRAIAMTQREGNRRALLDRFRQSRGWGAQAAQIRELKLPALIIWGGKDRLIPPVNAGRFHEDIAGSKLAIFADLGHAPEEEDPAGTAAAVKEFLSAR